MTIDGDNVSLIKTKPKISSLGVTQESLKEAIHEDVSTKTEKMLSYENDEAKKTGKEIKAQNNEAAEERRRTGRYLAIGVTLIMLFIAFYNTLLRHATVLAGLLAPAIIMLLYILWLFYFARKKRAQVSSV